MNPERTVKWGDSRLDDLAQEVHGLRGLPEKVNALVDVQRAQRDLPLAVRDLSGDVRRYGQDLGRCFDAVRRLTTEVERVERELVEKLDSAELKREKREEEQRLERKSDRRWMFGSAMTAASLVIGALALLADKL